MDQEIAKMLSSLTNDELISNAKEAVDDLELAAFDERNSGWHEACFAVVLIYASELNRRGLKIDGQQGNEILNPPVGGAWMPW